LISVSQARFVRLGEREQTLAPVISDQRFGHGVFGSFGPPIAGCCHARRQDVAPESLGQSGALMSLITWFSSRFI
jgi:hypothetical protein